MKKSINTLNILSFSIFFVVIFYKQMIGLNLFVYNLALLALLSGVYKVFDFKNKLHLTVFSGALLSAIGTVFHASELVITLNIFSLIFLLGIINNRQLKSFMNVGFAAIGQFFCGIFCFFKIKNKSGKQSGRFKNIGRWMGLIIVPIIILVVFFNLYSASSSKFSNVFGFFGKFIENIFRFFVETFDFPLIFLFLFGLIISCAYFVKTKTITVFQEPKTDALTHTKECKYSGSMLGLLAEFRMGLVTFVLLNLLLAAFNVIDIWYVWINFEWEGELLKEFIHEGTFTLIGTLIISVGLVLILFRKNLNFFSKNKPLKILANVWLVQNMVMAISVLIRNLHYINYYNLAYLRIGVLLFLVIVFFGLVTVLIKINSTKNFYYLLRVNTLFAYVALVLFSLADWDVIIAKFNFNRSESAFVHLNFMVQLSDKALPYLDKSEQELQAIEQSPTYKAIGHERYYMKPTEYRIKIQERKARFMEDYSERSFLEWNYADYKAYQMLTEGK